MTDSMRQVDVKQLNANVLAFYDQLPNHSMQEHEAGGQIGAAGLADLVESEADERIYEAAPKTGAR
jgi:hypothetical protein